MLHYLSFFLLVGTIGFVDLRILGVAGRGHTIKQIADELFPLMWVGMALAFLTGFIQFAGDATTFIPHPVFRLKIWIIVLAVLFGIVAQANVRKWDNLPAVPASAKVMAGMSILLWLGAILAALVVPDQYPRPEDLNHMFHWIFRQI